MSTDGTASCGNIAEESISTIRTAKAFGIQSQLGTLFEDKAVHTGRCDMKLAIVQGMSFAAFFFVNYAAYGLGESDIIILSGSSHKAYPWQPFPLGLRSSTRVLVRITFVYPSIASLLTSPLQPMLAK